MTVWRWMYKTSWKLFIRNFLIISDLRIWSRPITNIGWLEPSWKMLRDCVKFLQIIMQDWLRVKVQEKFRVYNKIMVIKQPNIEVSRFLDYNSVRVQSMVVRISKYFYQIGWWPQSGAVLDGVNKINGFRSFPAWLSLNTNHVNNIFEAIPKGFWVHLSKQRKTYFSDI